MGNLTILFRIPCMWHAICLLIVSKFSLWLWLLTFDFNVSHRGSLRVTLLGLLSFVSFIRFECSPIISSDSLPGPFSHFSASRTPIVCKFMCWKMFRKFRSLCPSSFFFPLCSSDRSLILSSSRLFLTPAAIYLWIPLVTFHFSYCIFHLLKKKYLVSF